ncbi:MAG: DCC1-like thiol-disulfide oxidoreductase family protein [Kiloniellales bacterium]|nr:DCC1-like thiol-disulfide oxidoreductase family protein [Kiloniellales bacterium]
MKQETAARSAELRDGAVVVYDGECPFCTRYAGLVRLREAVGPVTLLDAREGGPLVSRLSAAGYDLDEGMVLLYGGQIYHGGDCMHMLALLSGGGGAVNRLCAAVFRNPGTARRLYPVLRAGRNAVLRLLGRDKIGAASGPGAQRET